ncbi:MAG TPA: tetratricopeptide repeat protein [Gemmata sp.]|jgi:tetratricopeptide (TPR) repeat protein|nr:tetratricopeptide repeat protein [Gemmata sp.]
MGKRYKWAVGVVAALAIFGGGISAWRRFHPEAMPFATPPEIPSLIVEPEVRAVLNKARQRAIDEPRSELAWGELGLINRAHALNQESIVCFAEAAKLNSSSPRWPYLIGTVNLIIAPDEAIPYLRTAYSLAAQADDRSAARLLLAEALLDHNELDEATRLFDEELAVNPQNPRGHYGLGVTNAKRGNTAAAIDHLLVAAKSPLSRQKASALLATNYYQLDQADKAARFEKESVRPPVDQPWPDSLDSGVSTWLVGSAARQRRVNELQANGRHLEAVAVLQEMARNNPEERDEVTIGIYLGMQGNWTAAEKAFRSALARNSDHATGRCFLGESLYFQAVAKWESGNRDAARQQFEAALVEFGKSIELKPDMGQAHLFAACSMKYLGRLPDAAAECRTAIQVMPQSADAHYTLGEVLHQQGKSGEAVSHLENAVRLAPPHDTRAKTLLQQILAEKPN